MKRDWFLYVVVAIFMLGHFTYVHYSNETKKTQLLIDEIVEKKINEIDERLDMHIIHQCKQKENHE